MSLLKKLARSKKITQPKVVDEDGMKKKISLKKYKIVDGSFLLESDRALLLAEACKLNKEIKKAEKRLKAIKVELSFDTKGDYVNKAGDKVVVSLTPKKSDIDPQRLYKLMLKNKMQGRFWGVVKVQLTPLKKVIPESAIEKLQNDLDPIVKCSFK